jgi:hypothetical protein
MLYLLLLLQYYWGDGNYIGGLNPRSANPYVHVSCPGHAVPSTSPVHFQALTGIEPWPCGRSCCQRRCLQLFVSQRQWLGALPPLAWPGCCHMVLPGGAGL